MRVYSVSVCVWHGVGDLCAFRATVLNHRSTNFEWDRFFLCENWYLGVCIHYTYIHTCVYSVWVHVSTITIENRQQNEIYAKPQLLAAGRLLSRVKLARLL